MRKVLAMVGLALVALGGCTWLVPEQPDLFPEEIAPGWRRDAEAELAVEEKLTKAAAAVVMPMGFVPEFGSCSTRAQATETPRQMSVYFCCAS